MQSPDHPPTVSGDALVGTIVEEVAANERKDPLELPPLANHVDPDALTSLVASSNDDSFSIRFTYCGYTVTISGSGQVEVVENEDA